MRKTPKATTTKKKKKKKKKKNKKKKTDPNGTKGIEDMRKEKKHILTIK